MEPAREKGRRWVISTQEEMRRAAIDVASEASRRLSIFTHDLEPGIYDDPDFLEVVKHLILSQRYARVRVLIADPTRAIKNGNAFVALGRRLNTYIEFRHVRRRGRLLEPIQDLQQSNLPGRPETVFSPDFARLLVQRAEIRQGIACVKHQNMAGSDIGDDHKEYFAGEAALKAANVKYERYLYPGTQHGFNNDTTPRFDAAAAKLAWQRTIDFLNKNLR